MTSEPTEESTREPALTWSQSHTESILMILGPTLVILTYTVWQSVVPRPFPCVCVVIKHSINC